MLDAHKGSVEPLNLAPGISHEELRDFLAKIYLMGASDIKFQSNDFVWADLNRRWQPVTDRRLEQQEVERVLTLLNDQSALGLIQWPGAG